jgi:hypothetical protein
MPQSPGNVKKPKIPVTLRNKGSDFSAKKKPSPMTDASRPSF